MPPESVKWEYTAPDPLLVQQAQLEFDVPEIYARVLVQRGISTRAAGGPFFQAARDQLHDPFLMKGMDTAVDRILDQLRRERPILIFGDYDVDGTTAASLLYLFLRSVGGRISTYIPDRGSEGYGLSQQGIDYAGLIGADLLITCDCGINAVERVAYAREKGVEVIITDHHIPDTNLPEAVAILNPKQVDCPYPFKSLCGCGVAFKLALAVAERGGFDPELAWDQVDLVALATAADMVPIIAENRVMVRAGLRRMEEHPRPGLSALRQVTGMAGRDLTVGRLVFNIAPKINAAGRLGDAGRAVKLLTTTNPYQAISMARELVEENTRRQQIQESTVEEAVYLVNAHHDLSREKALVVAKEGWHAGVIGIVAARIRDQFHRPTVIIALENGVGKGSLRSMAGFDLHQALTHCREHLIDFGGHTVAAGLSLRSDQLPAFERQFLAWADSCLTADQLLPRQVIEGDCTLDTIDSRFMRFLGSLEPHGPGNRRPVFAARGVQVMGRPSLVGGSAAHLKFKVGQEGATFEAIGFNLADHYEKLLVNQPLNIAYVVEEDQWRGNRRVQLLIKDIKLENEQ
ncbi:MAG: single-stranded-DNA-specific exonuclease RecJ [Candidatus Marinimicrobia bacterium]|nr:single-stranded-DNA-specific exonuclease RecJ [Candidatus Neomarinimicrobiota bacterium]